jgi:large subunit ribosomal protein L35
MPKIKTYKAAAKRFKITGTGKILRMKQGRGHLKRRKSKRSKRALRKYHSVAKADRKKVRRLLNR